MALLYLALYGGYSDFMSPLELAAIGMAALEVRKPLGAVAYAYAVAITHLSHTFYGYFFIMLTAAWPPWCLLDGTPASPSPPWTPLLSSPILTTSGSWRPR